jgi:hypothetical protein
MWLKQIWINLIIFFELEGYLNKRVYHEDLNIRDANTGFILLPDKFVSGFKMIRFSDTRLIDITVIIFGPVIKWHLNFQTSNPTAKDRSDKMATVQTKCRLFIAV